MAGLITNYISHGSGAPSAPSVPSTENALYIDETNDLYYFWKAGAAAWRQLGTPGYTAPPTGVTWSWVNQGSDTIDETTGLYLYCPIDASDTWRGRWKSAPATPYTIDICLEPYLNIINYNGIAVGWRNSGSGSMVLAEQGVNTADTGYKTLNIGKANTTSITSNYLTDITVAEYYRWMRIADDGTNRITSVSRDGLHWLQIHSVARTDYVTADQVGFAVEARNASLPAALSILSWREH
jgi:hypothetical protein